MFWRVRIGIYRTQQEVNTIRQRFTAAGLGDTWMREVPDSELPETPPPPQPAPPPTTRGTVSIDSVAASLVESMSSLARRAVDSLETVSQRRLEHLLQRMQESFAEEVYRQVEEDRAQERSTYVTQMEQSQMTRALLDEMHANLDALRDSLDRDREARQRQEALKPRISGTVSTLSSITHRRPDVVSPWTIGDAAEVSPRVVVEWGDERSHVLIDARSSLNTVELSQVFVTWDVYEATPDVNKPDRRGITTTIGAGRFSPPYGLEPTSSGALLAPWPSEISRMRISPTGIWIVPATNEGFRLLLVPYGNWSANDEQGSGLVQMRLTPGAWRVELTGLGEREAARSGGLIYDTRGRLVVEWNTPRWVVGTEFMVRIASNPDAIVPTDETWWGTLALVHWRFAPRWGWTLRGDYLDRTKELTSGDTVQRTGTILTGPIFSITNRLSLKAAYEFTIEDHRDIPGGKLLRDYQHVFGVGFSHAF